jgi:hypothetical protein
METFTPPAGLTRGRLIIDMTSCQQARGQTILQHGEAVRRIFLAILTHLRTGSPAPSWWRLPSWASSNDILDRLLPDNILEEYQIFHDCGKPYTRTVDADGRQHFPGHATASEKIWLAIGGNEQAARLMRMDMDAHLLKADGLTEFASRPEAASLLLTALAETHANAEMFGGTDSDSFKMKAKHLEKRGRQSIQLMA